MKTVAIIGAGPSGLVAARTFLRQQPKAFDVSVFERQDGVGGMWAVLPGEQDKMLNPNMPTNASYFAESFGDLSWRSVDLSDPSIPTSAPGYIPAFPRAWQVGRYLEAYARKFLPHDVLNLNCEVTEALELSEGDTKRWLLSWKDHGTGNISVRIFDYLIVASGFFSLPRPFSLGNGLDGSEQRSSPVSMIHSSRCRSLFNDVVREDWDGNGDIMVIGGSMSGAEAATALAFQLSNRRYAPGASSWGNAKVTHVVSRPFYAVPPLLPKTNTDGSISFLPSDLYFFNLDRRASSGPSIDPIKAGYGKLPEWKAQASHKAIQSLIGNQRDLGAPALVADRTDEPAYIAITAGGMYSEFVRHGLIKPVAGRATELTANQGQEGQPTVTATVDDKGSQSKLTNIAGIVYATGYSPLPALNFLTADVKQKIEYDPDSYRLPVLLQECQSTHPGVPNLGFVGFYEAPYWSVAEMQARLLAQKWSIGSKAPASHKPSEQTPDNTATLEKMRDLRSAMHARASDVPQYWNGDTVGLMEEMSSALDITRNDDGFPGRSGPVTISRYSDAGSDEEKAAKAREDLHQILARSAGEGLFVAWAAFRAMHGKWGMKREIKSRLSSMPSGRFVGEAHFHPRVPTAEGYTGEYLYIEEGDFETSTGFKMKATRRYVLRYSEETDRITSWFVKEDSLTVDYLFLDLELQQRTSRQAPNSWVATSRHPCAPDMYDAIYDWRFDKAALGTFSVTFAVKGPHKDYVSTTRYERLGSQGYACNSRHSICTSI